MPWQPDSQLANRKVSHQSSSALQKSKCTGMCVVIRSQWDSNTCWDCSYGSWFVSHHCGHWLSLVSHAGTVLLGQECAHARSRQIMSTDDDRCLTICTEVQWHTIQSNLTCLTRNCLSLDICRHCTNMASVKHHPPQSTSHTLKSAA